MKKEVCRAVLLLSAFWLLAVAGCAALGPERPAPVTVEQIVEMSQAGVPAGEIIDRIRKSDTVYRLEASKLADLRDAGVADAVINYMQQTYIDELRRNAFLEDQYYWTPGGAGYWYGGSPYGWPYDRRW